MTNEFDFEPFGATPDPQEPANTEDTQSSSIFDKTVFGYAQQSAPQTANDNDDPFPF